MERDLLNKINFYTEKEEAKDAFDFCQKHYGQSDLDKAQVQVVLGGDGSILTALKQQMKLGINIPVFGLNYGSKGWLCNSPDTKNLCERIRTAQKQTIMPLQITTTSAIDGKKTVAYAFNEFYISRFSPQCVHLPIFIKNREMKFRWYIEGDGIIMATPMGSNAYYAAMGGSPVEMSKKALLIRSNNTTTKPRDFLMSEDTEVAICKYEGKKRPMMVEGDGQRIENISRAVVKYAFDKKKTLLFERFLQNQH